MKKLLLKIPLLLIALYAQPQSAILEPSANSQGNFNVIKNEKIELGVIPPSNVKNAVDQWLTKNKVDRIFQQIAYANVVTGSPDINPFDENEIKVKAVFKHVSTLTTYTREGFYYRNFETYNSPVATLKNWGGNPVPNCPNSYACNENNTSNTTVQNKWREISDPYDFRIRFSPDRGGLWEVRITLEAKLNGTTVNVAYPVMTFSCQATTNSYNGYLNSGLLKLNANGRFLQFAQTGKTFIPVGQNSWDAIPGNDLYGGECWGKNRSDYLQRFYAQLSFVRQSEGNFFRIGSNAYDFDIEWEKLGNYDTRMCTAWEVDSLVNYAHKNGLYFIYNLISHHSFWWAWHCPDPAGQCNLSGRGHSNSWNSNPYRNLLGQNGPWDYFSNQTAKQMVKQKLRYIISRWGYSTNIAAWEILDEPTGVKQCHPSTSGKTEAQFETEMIDWFREMSDYIKTTLGDQHLITASYDPYIIRNHPNIDIAQYHSYYNREDGNYKIRSEEIKLFHATNPGINKPLFFGEMGTRPEALEKEMDVQFHNDYWATLMMGDLGPGLSWHYRYNDNNGSDSTIRAIRKFTNNEELAANTFQVGKNRTYHFQPDSFKYEGYYLTRNDRKHTIGWVHNRSYYIQNYARSFGNQTQINLYSDNTLVACQPNTSYNRSKNCEIATFKPDDEYFRGFVSNWPSPGNPSNPGINPCGCSSPIVSTLVYPMHFDEVVPLPQNPYIVHQLMSNSKYTISFYKTRIAANTPYLPQYTSTACTDANGDLIILIPPTDNINPDWAFKLDFKETCPSKINADEARTNPTPIETQHALLNKSSFDCRVFPNPSTGEFMLEIGTNTFTENTSFHLEVFDVVGKLVYQLDVKDTLSKITLSSLSKGTYTMKLSNGKQDVFKSIIIN